jgi:uncharacterized RDD family membrane protein YckC
METVLDENLIEEPKRQVRYAGFWPRFGASVIDMILLIPIVFIIAYFSLTSFGTPWLYIVISILAQAYRPVMETVYGGTLGKLALDLRIVNVNHKKAGLSVILIRNAPYLIPSLISVIVTSFALLQSGVEQVNSIFDMRNLTESSTLLNSLNALMYLFLVVDIIVFFADRYQRAWHDKIAGTFVIHTK